VEWVYGPWTGRTVPAHGSMSLHKMETVEFKICGLYLI
jgi:hypothetical protein